MFLPSAAGRGEERRERNECSVYIYCNNQSIAIFLIVEKSFFFLFFIQQLEAWLKNIVFHYSCSNEVLRVRQLKFFDLISSIMKGFNKSPWTLYWPRQHLTQMAVVSSIHVNLGTLEITIIRHKFFTHPHPHPV